MNNKLIPLGMLSWLFLVLPVYAVTQVGRQAPDIKIKDVNAKAVDLKNYRGKYVVLEWTNRGCPYVGKHYNSGNMQKLQATVTAPDFTKEGVAWFTIVSSAKGKQGYMTNKEALKWQKDNKGNQTTIILDGQGTIGKSYGAKTTPHMFIIDPKGVLVYRGAVDSNDSTSEDSIKNATNYVIRAFDDLKANRTVNVSDTKPYGCSVKY